MTTWGTRKTAGAVVVAGAIAAVGGAAISAATTTGHHGIASGQHDAGRPAQVSTEHTVGGLQGSLHGEFVESDGAGQFVTRLVQTGRVTAISATALTARSVDGFTQSYVIEEAEDAAAPPFSIGQVVVINATRKGEANMVDTMRPPLTAGN